MAVKSFIAFVFALGVWATSVAAVPVGSGGVECSLSSERESFSALEPIWLKLVCVNQGTVTSTLFLGPGAKVGLRLTPPASGNACGSKVFDEPLRRAETVVRDISPQETVNLRVPLSRWFHGLIPGRYKAVLIDCRASREGEDPHGETLSSEIVFDVRPLNEKQLALVCDELARDALSTDADKAREAAEALSSIDSQIAVPYLRKVLFAKVFSSYFVIDGLARLNTPETVQILVEAFEEADAFTRAKLKRSLSEVTLQVKDPALRKSLDMIQAWQPRIVK